MRIALLCPSRERLNRKLTLISSLLTTVKDPNNIRLYLGVDEDDPTREMVYRIANCIPFIHVIDVPKISTPPNIHKIWNYCASGVMNDPQNQILALCADDFVFRTPNWDEMIIDEFTGDKLPKDKIKLVTCNDTHKNGAIPVNYFIHKRYVELTGYIARPEFIINWCDNWIKTTYLSLGRYHYRPDIIIEHQHWVFSGKGPDAIGQQMMEREQGTKANSDDLWPLLEPERYKEVMLIAATAGIQPDLVRGEFSQRFIAGLK